MAQALAGSDKPAARRQLEDAYALLEQLAASGAREFCFVFSPLRLKGATGSPGNPIAIR